jgi:glycosidase
VSGPLPDPGDPATFAAAVLRRDRSLHGELWHLYRDLIALRRTEPALHRSTRENTLAHADGKVVTLVRSGAGSSVAALFNLCGEAGAGRLPPGRRWEEAIRTDGANGTMETIPLDPWGFRVFRAQATAMATGGR